MSSDGKVRRRARSVRSNSPSERQRVDDERLRELLRNADLRKLDRALERIVKPLRTG
jgi:nitroreductase